MKETYTYAVSRVRCRETDLLTRLDFDRLMQCKTEEECLRTLQDKGWGKEAGVSLSAEDLLSEENTRLWQFAGELVPDLSVFNVLRLPADFNNLKAAIKSVLTKTSPPHIYMAGGTVDPALMQEAVEKNDFSLLPPFLSEPGRQAAQVLQDAGVVPAGPALVGLGVEELDVHHPKVRPGQQGADDLLEGEGKVGLDGRGNAPLLKGAQQLAGKRRLHQHLAAG